MKSAVASHQNLTTNWGNHWSWSFYTKWEFAQDLSVNYSMVVRHLKQIRKLKKSHYVGASWADCKKKKKKCCFEVLSYFMQQWTISLWIVTCNKKWNLYDNWQWPAQWSNPEGTPKPNLLQKKVMVTVWSSAAHLIHYSFLNPMTSLQRSIISKSMRCNKNCNACSKQWSTERTQFFSTTTLYHTSHN